MWLLTMSAIHSGSLGCMIPRELSMTSVCTLILYDRGNNCERDLKMSLHEVDLALYKTPYYYFYFLVLSVR